MKIPVPPLKIQQEIVNDCTAIDNKTEEKARGIKKIQAEIEALCLHDNFETKKLLQVVDIQSNVINPLQETGSVFFVGLENIESDTGRLIGNPLTQYSTIKSNKNIYKKGDLLYRKLRPNLNKLYLAQEDGICSTDILVLRCKDRNLNSFYAYYMRTKKFNSEVLKTVSGQQLPRTKWDLIKAIKVPIPKDKEEINTQLKKLEMQLFYLQKELAELSAQKNNILFNEIYKKEKVSIEA